jgi:hypothetical protein
MFSTLDCPFTDLMQMHYPGVLAEASGLIRSLD